MNTGRLLPRAVLGLAIAAAISVSLAYRGQLDPAAFEAWLAGFGILAPLASVWEAYRTRGRLRPLIEGVEARHSTETA